MKMFKKMLMLMLTAVIMVSFTACSALEEDEEKFSSEGSYNAPVNLYLNTSHNTEIAAYEYSENTSYYRFTPSNAGTYTISADSLSASTNLDFYLDNLGLTAEGTSTSGETITVTLAAYQACDIRITNQGNSGTYYSLSVIESAPTVLSYEGSIASPVTLTMSSVHSGKVGIYAGESQSYYSFTPVTTALHTITVDGLSAPTDLDLWLYTTPDFNTYTDGSQLGGDTGESFTTLSSLNAGQTYYLMVNNSSSANATNYNLLVTP